MRYAITLQLAPAEDPVPLTEDDAGLLLFEEVNGLVQGVLAERMPDDPEADVLDAIDAAVVVECDEEALEDDALTFLVALHWTIGGYAAEHWWRIGLGLVWDDVVAAVREQGWQVVSERPDPAAVARETDRPALIAFGEHLVAVTHGEVVLEEGVAPLEHEVEAELLAVASDGRCRCGLCRQLG